MQVLSFFSNDFRYYIFFTLFSRLFSYHGKTILFIVLSKLIFWMRKMYLTNLNMQKSKYCSKMVLSSLRPSPMGDVDVHFCTFTASQWVWECVDLGERKCRDNANFHYRYTMCKHGVHRRAAKGFFYPPKPL